MKNAFFCSGPYQVFIAISIKEKYLKDTDSDIYILDHLNFKGAKSIARELAKNSQLFKRVKYVDCTKLSQSFSKGSKIERYYRFFRTYHNLNQISQTHFDFGTRNYDEIFFSNTNNVINIAALYLHKQNKKLKTNLFEDGLGGYTDDLRKLTWRQLIFQKVTRSSKIFNYNKYFLFKPELYRGTIPRKKIKKIPTITQDESELRKYLNQIFGYNLNNQIDEKVIFFEQPIPGIDRKIMEEIFHIFGKTFKNDFIVKLHPRTNFKNKTNSIKIHSSFNIPWEIEALNNQISNKILVSFFSTALVSNKMIFNEEPYLIFLYNIEEVKKNWTLSEDILLFMEKFKSTYINNSRILIPSSLEELKKIVKLLETNSL